MTLKTSHNKPFFSYAVTASLLTLFISGFFIRSWFHSFNLGLDVPAKLFISQATFEGQDVEKRLSCFFTLLLRSAILMPLLFGAFSWVLRKISNTPGDLYALTVLAGTGVVLFLCSAIGIKNDASLSLLAVSILFTLLALLQKKLKPSYRYIGHTSFIAIVFCVAFILLSLLLFFANSYTLSQAQVTILFGLLLACISAIIFLIKNLYNAPIKIILKYLQVTCIVPLCIFFSIETSFLLKLKQHFIVSPFWLFAIYFSLGLLLCLYLIRRKNIFNLSKSISVCFAPSALLSFILLTVYHPVLPFSREIFELANPANALMKIFAYHEIPCVDFMSSHMLAEQFYGVIYFLLFGFDHSQSFLVYSFLYTLIFMVLAYLFLKQLIGSASLATLFLICFPFIFPFFSMHLFYAVLVFFTVRKILFDPSTANYVWLFALLVLLIAWRLDTGSATLLATCFFLPITFYVTGVWPNLKNVIKAISITAASLLAILTVFVLLRSPEYLLTNINTAFHYISANQAHGYTYLARVFNHQFYIYYFIIPLFSLLAVFYIIYQLRRNKIHWNCLQGFTLSASLFFFLICLFSFQRGLVRHSFMEESEHFLVSTFYLALALFLLSYVQNNHPAKRFLFLFSTSTILFILVKYFPVSTDPTLLEKFCSNNSLLKTNEYVNNVQLNSRVLPDEEFARENYTDLKTFLDVNLTSGQSFLDFSNSPMLYYYCQRNVPSYFCQSLQNTVDDYLQLNLIKRNTIETTPVALFSNYPATWFDATDDVPNTLRQYLVAEYIFRYYKPLCVFGKRSVWIANNKSFKGAGNIKDTVCMQPKTYNYNMGPNYINRYYEFHEFENLEKINSIAAADSGEVAYINIDSTVSTLHHVYARIIIDNPLDAETIKVEMNDTEGNFTGTFSVRTFDGGHAYMIRLSSHYLWHIRQTKQLSISKNKNVHISHVEFYKDTRL